MEHPYHFYLVSQSDVFGGLVRSPAFWSVALLMLAVSVYHDRRLTCTLRAYAATREEAGAEAAGWPGEHSVILRLGPHLLYAGSLVALLLGFGQISNVLVSTLLDVLMRHPHPAPPLGLVWPAAAGLALGVVLLEAAGNLRRSPWCPVAERVRRAVHANELRCRELFAEALALDPGMPNVPAAGVCPPAIPNG